MFRFCRLIIMSDSMKLKILSTKSPYFYISLWPIGIFSSFSKALHRLPGFDIKPRPSPSLSPPKMAKPGPSLGQAQAEPRVRLGSPKIPLGWASGRGQARPSPTFHTYS